MRFRALVVVLVAVLAISIGISSAQTGSVGKIGGDDKLKSLEAEVASLRTQLAADEKRLAATEDTANKARTAAGLLQIAYDHDMPALKPLPARLQILEPLQGKVAVLDALPGRVSALESLPGKLQSLDQDYRTHRHDLNNELGIRQDGQFRYVITGSADALKRHTSTPVH